MKNSPEEEWLHSLEKRLRDYTEEPDAGLWNKITEKVSNDREPIWIPWLDRAAAVIALTAVLALLAIRHNDVSDHARNDSGKIELSPGKNQSLLKMGDTLLQPGLSQPEKNIAAMKNYSHNVSQKNKEVTFIAANDHRELVNTEIIPEPMSRSTMPVLSERKKDAEKMAIADSIKQLLLKDDSVEFKIETTGKKKPEKKKGPLIVYSTITPLLTYHKVTPYENDGIVINKFNGKPILSGERLGASVEVGVQGRLSEKLEFFAGLSIYKQSQTLTYEYQAGDDVNVEQQANLSYTVTPAITERKLNYNMLTVGGQAGILYLIRGGRLRHKIGAGLSYQSGILKSVEGTYMNDRSKYLFYQIFYRNEYSINSTISVFIQPFYTHAVISKEILDEPFRLTPYRAGIGFGLTYRFN